MGKKPLYLKQIRRHAPDLTIKSAAFNRDGQFNDVLIINDAFVFRFAKVKPAIETLQRELMLLQHLQGRLPLPIPNPVYHNVQSSVLGEVFMGYPLIAGQSLWRDAFHAIGEQQTLDHIAQQLAAFLQTLHGIDVTHVFPEALPPDNSLAFWRDMFEQIRAKLFTYMRPGARIEVEAHFDRYLNNPIPFNPTLRHGDFGTGNILFSAEKSTITGIIDFGFTQLGDPASDFAGLYASYGEDFYHRCCRSYPEMETALDRVHFYIGTFALQEALHGIEHDDAAAFEAGIAEYR